MSKFEIITLVIIIIIICIILYSCQETFINGTVNLEITNNLYGHKYFSNITNKLKHNIYFVANKDPNDPQHLYLMNHDMKIVKRKIPRIGYTPPEDGSKDDFSMTDREIYNISFIIDIETNKENGSNQMSFFKLRNLAEEQTDELKNFYLGKTFPRGDEISILQNVYFIRNEPGNSNLGFKIVRYTNRSSDGGGRGNEYLEIDYNTIATSGVGYSFKQGHQIQEKYKHTFYLIPFICNSGLSRDTDLHYRGFRCLWQKRV